MFRDSQALRVRYVGPTNTKPARVIVTESVPAHMGRNPSHTMEWQDDLDPRENRLLAAQEYLDQCQFGGPEPVRVNPNGLCFDGDYFYTWSTKYGRGFTSEDFKTVLDFILEYGGEGSLPNMDEGGSGDVAYEAALRLRSL